MHGPPKVKKKKKVLKVVFALTIITDIILFQKFYMI